MSVAYKPFDERVPDVRYRSLLERLLTSGRWVQPQNDDVRSLMVVGEQWHLDLRNGFPIITERDLVSAEDGKSSQFSLAIAELCAFLNGAQTLDEMRAFGCGWWSRWVTSEKCAKRGLAPGDLGPGSYGAAFRRFPTSEGTPFDQMTHLLEQIRELPHLRTHFVSPWIPQYIGRGRGKQQKVVVVPCHGWFHVFLFPEQGELSLHHFQRSADVPVGLVFNLIQYAALTLMLAQVFGYAARELVFSMSDIHCYQHVHDPEKDHLPHMRDMLNTTARAFPTVTLDDSVTDLFAFRPHHFTVSDYEPSLERRMIWTPV